MWVISFSKSPKICNNLLTFSRNRCDCLQNNFFFRWNFFLQSLFSTSDRVYVPTKFNWAFGQLNTSQFTKKTSFFFSAFSEVVKRNTLSKNTGSQSFNTWTRDFRLYKGFCDAYGGKNAFLRVHRDVSNRRSRDVWGQACLAWRPWIYGHRWLEALHLDKQRLVKDFVTKKFAAAKTVPQDDLLLSMKAKSLWMEMWLQVPSCNLWPSWTAMTCDELCEIW